MSTFLTPTAARALYDRAMLPRPRRVTPELDARLAADLTEQIGAAKGYGRAMLGEHEHGLASYGFTEAARMGELRRCYQREEPDDETLT